MHTQKLPILGSVLIAVFSISVATASADTFKSETSTSVTVTGTQGVVAVFKTTAGSAECKKATFIGTGTHNSSSVLLAPTYSECTCIGVACTVDTNECVYRLNIGAGTTGLVDVVCPTEKTITLTNTKCTIYVGSQTGLGTMTYSITGSGPTREIVASFVMTENIKYNHTEGTGVGKCTTGSSTTGSISGTGTGTGETDGGSTHVGIFTS